MYTIGQFSKICQVTTKALRHYEKIGLLIPAKVDDVNQYRYYTREQVALVQSISQMKELDIPLKTAKKLIESMGEPPMLLALLEEHRQALVSELELCNSRLVRLTWWQKTLEANKMSETKKYDIIVRDIPEVLVRNSRKVLKSMEEFPPMIRDLLEEIVSAGGVCAGAPIMLYYDEEFNPNKIDVEVAWPVADQKLATKTLPGLRAATCMHVGPYTQLCEAYEAIFGWVNQNGHRALFPFREISHNDPRHTPPEQLVTEIIVPLAQ